MSDSVPTDLPSSYDRVAQEYVDRIFHELAGKPLDRQLLEQFAMQVKGKGVICDMGCGPGHVARYLHQQGANVFGLDLSPGMIEQARRLNPGIEFGLGDMSQLDVADEAWAGIVAFYSILHIPRSEVTAALREFKRVLKPDGLLLLAFHIGQEERHVDEMWQTPVSLDFIFFESDEMATYLHQAGFVVENITERGPYVAVEVETKRSYILARKPSLP